MTANELRIGNYLYDTQVGFKDEFKIMAGDIVEIQKNPEHEYIPIPLTEEWLLKFGFLKQGKSMQWDIPVVSSIIKADTFCLYQVNFKEFHFGSQSLIVKYVHELQNLYFALTGEELTIK